MLARFGAVVGIIFAVALTAFCLLVAFPSSLFASTIQQGRIAIYSDEPIDPMEAKRFVDEVEARLELSPLNQTGAQYRIFIADSPIKKRLFFLPALGAGGVVYFWLSGQNVFLSGADFRNGRLVSQDGVAIAGVRSLAYYGAHEISHLQIGARIGVVRYLRLPRWVGEGLPDYLALPHAADQIALGAAVAGNKRDLAFWDAFGFYAEYRFAIDHLLRNEGWSLDHLLASDMTLMLPRQLRFANGKRAPAIEDLTCPPSSRAVPMPACSAPPPATGFAWRIPI